MKYSENEAEEDSGWHTLVHLDNNEKKVQGSSFCLLENNQCCITVTHFTRFTFCGRQSSNAEISLWALAYFTVPTVDRDCTVRVYIIPATEAALEVSIHSTKSLDRFDFKPSAKIAVANLHKLNLFNQRNVPHHETEIMAKMLAKHTRNCRHLKILKIRGKCTAGIHPSGVALCESNIIYLVYI